MPAHLPDTIAAISTPPGRGGIGIVRLSGPDAIATATALLRLTRPLRHAQASFLRIPDPAHRDTDNSAVFLDEALVTVFLAPHSYTGEDLVEIAAHGSPVILETILRAALALSIDGRSARLARPGEFTQRAFLSGRLDLTQAEAVHDLIAAQSIDQARVAAQQLGGALSRRIAPAKETLLHLIALLEAGMDFASGELDDVDVVSPAHIDTAILQTRMPLEVLAATFRRGQLLRNGASIALVGRPNAGKSSLFNRLLERDRAIVTPHPGTTRDTVEESVSLAGIPLRLIDTAGLRTDAHIDEAEQQGIARTREALADADLVLVVHDATLPLASDEVSIAAALTGRPHLLILNKSDLLPDSASDVSLSGAWLRTSALTGDGLSQVRSAILHQLQAEGSLADSGALNTLRQHEAVSASLSALSSAAAANDNALPHELILLDLHAALSALDSLTGITTPDDILARIFSTFCIGK
jgi:tRNA modification GTPase